MLLTVAGLTVWWRVQALGRAVEVAGARVREVTSRTEGLARPRAAPVVTPAGHLARPADPAARG